MDAKSWKDLMEEIRLLNELKLNSTGALRELAKLFLNNLYGKMASSTDSSFKKELQMDAKSWKDLMEEIRLLNELVNNYKQIIYNDNSIIANQQKIIEELRGKNNDK